LLSGSIAPKRPLVAKPLAIVVTLQGTLTKSLRTECESVGDSAFPHFFSLASAVHPVPTRDQQPADGIAMRVRQPLG
jgi:hypothetical protein